MEQPCAVSDSNGESHVLNKGKEGLVRNRQASKLKRACAGKTNPEVQTGSSADEPERSPVEPRQQRPVESGESMDGEAGKGGGGRQDEKKRTGGQGTSTACQSQGAWTRLQVCHGTKLAPWPNKQRKGERIPVTE